jgi:hypothetical protein
MNGNNLGQHSLNKQLRLKLILMLSAYTPGYIFFIEFVGIFLALIGVLKKRYRTAIIAGQQGKVLQRE